MSTPRYPSSLVLGALGLCLTVGACKDDPPTPKLFEEDGVWSTVRYDLTGGGSLTAVDTANRKDAFMLSFDAAERVVTTAACIERDSDTPANSTCALTPSTTRWDCRCFAYDFVREEMLWREFVPGDVPPTVSLSAADAPPASDDTGTGDGGGGGDDLDTNVFVADVMEVGSTYSFRPLPDGVFGSNGESSRFILQQRAASVFDRVYDDPQGRPTCEPCVP